MKLLLKDPTKFYIIHTEYRFWNIPTHAWQDPPQNSITTKMKEDEVKVFF